MKFNNKICFSIVICFSFFPLLSLIQWSYAQDIPIKIGALLDLSGPNMEIGTLSYNALQRYLRVVNASGGIKGRPLELLVADTKSDEAELLIGATRLKMQEVKILIGPSAKENVILLRRFAETHKIPLVLICGNSPILTYRTIKTKWTFSTTLTFDAEIKSLFSAFRKRGYESLSVLVQANNDYKKLSLWIKGYAPEYMLKLGCFEAFYLNMEDINYKFQYITKCMPDVCLIWADRNAYGFIRKIDSIQIPIAISHSLLKKELISNKANWQLGYVALPRLLAKNFVSSIRLTPEILFFFSLWPRDEFFSLSLEKQLVIAQTWDSLMVTVIALKNGMGINRRILRDALEEYVIDYKGLVGRITFDKRDHSGLSPNSLSVLSNFGGRWSLIR